MNPLCLFWGLVLFILTAGTVAGSEPVRIERGSSSPEVSSRRQNIQVRDTTPEIGLQGAQNSVENASSPQPASDQTQTPAFVDPPEAAAQVPGPSSVAPIASQPKQAKGDLRLAWKSLGQGRLETASRQFRRWIQASDQALAKEARLGLAYALAAQGDAIQARNLLAALAKSGYRTAETAAVALDLSLATEDLQLARELLPLLPRPVQAAARAKIDLAVAKERVTRAPRGSVQERDALDAFLRVAPNDAPARERLAWLLLEQKDAIGAASQFSALRSANPGQAEYARGLALALQAQGKIDDALATLGAPPRLEWIALARGLHLEAAQRLTNDGRHAAALIHVEKAARLGPLQRSEQEFSIWTLMAAGQTDQAAVQSAMLYREYQDRAAATLYFDILQAAGSAVQLQALEKELATSSDIALRAVLAERLGARGELRSAASANPQPTPCYSNCDQPDVSLGLTMRRKDGDSGLSRLDQMSTPMEIRYPLSDGRIVRAGAVMHHLDAGAAPQTPYMGSYFRSLDGRQADGSNIEEQTVWVPYVAIGAEKPSGSSLELGTTPLNAVVDPMPVFKFAYREKGNYRISVQQCAVQDSMLSFVGQRDPYSDARWGRILRTGLELEKTFDLEDAYWLTLTSRADYYWGYNVEDNVSFTGTASLGKTFAWSDIWATNIGIFSTTQHFHRNSDFQTYGHGGYFSPELFVMAGPFVRMTSPLCRTWFVDAEASLGLMHYRTANADKYVGADASNVIDPDALAEWQGEFLGESKTGVGASGRLQALRLLTDWTALGGFAAINTSTDHQQWEVGLLFRIFFDPRNGLCDAQTPTPEPCR